MKPVLDVVIPCYRAADTLTASVESAVNQTCVSNVWLVDDASDDGTAEVMKTLSACYPQVKCEFLSRNSGAAQARNWGAWQSQADFVAFLDADDTYEPEALNAAYMALSQFSYLSLIRLKLKPCGFPERYLQHPHFERAWQNMMMSGGGNTVFRRSIFLACGGFPQDILFRRFGGEDAALGIALTRASVVGTLFGTEDAGVNYVYRPGVHAEKLLDSALFGQAASGVEAEHLQQAEAITAAICRRLAEVKEHVSFNQTGITALQTTYRSTDSVGQQDDAV